MRTMLAVLLVPLLGAKASAGEPPDALAQAFVLVADARPELHQRAFDVLVEQADRARLASAAQAATSEELRGRLLGALYLVDLAGRFTATKADSAARWMTLEEALRSEAGRATGAMLARAGLSGLETMRLLAARAEARRAAAEYFEQAYQHMNDPREVVASAVRGGSALVPHLLEPLSVQPWLFSWPSGLNTMQRRMACWVLQALRVREAIPYLLLQLEAPSATLEWDVAAALVAITGDNAFEVPPDAEARARAKEHRWTWWAAQGQALAPAARSLALDSLRTAADYLTSLLGNPKHFHGIGGEGAPDPVTELLAFLERMHGYTVPQAPGGADDPAARLGQIATALRHFEGLGR